MAATSLQQTKELALQHIDQAYIVSLLRRLVGTPSENPPGNELEMGRQLRQVLADLGIQVDLVEVEPQRPSVAGIIRGTVGSPTLVLNGHMDTVPTGDINDWTADPFGGEERGGRIFGRGSADMKGGITSIIAAVKAIRDASVPLKGNIVLQFAMGEETGEAGTKTLVEKGYVGDYGIVTEPTDLRVATAERGLAWLKVTLHGRSSHASTPQIGLNAIQMAARAVDIITSYNEALQQRSHPLLGSLTSTVTMIQGGLKENVVPDRCELIVDRRMLPGETAQQAQAELSAALKALLADYPEGRYDVELMRVFEAAEIEEDAKIVQVLSKNVENVLGWALPTWGTPYASDVRNLVNDGQIQAVTFGPGLIENAHCVDESIAIQQVVDAARVIALTALDLLGVDGVDNAR